MNFLLTWKDLITYMVFPSTLKVWKVFCLGKDFLLKSIFKDFRKYDALNFLATTLFLSVFNKEISQAYSFQNINRPLSCNYLWLNLASFPFCVAVWKAISVQKKIINDMYTNFSVHANLKLCTKIRRLTNILEFLAKKRLIKGFILTL